jgi:hypothetical protein
MAVAGVKCGEGLLVPRASPTASCASQMQCPAGAASSSGPSVSVSDFRNLAKRITDFVQVLRRPEHTRACATVVRSDLCFFVTYPNKTRTQRAQSFFLFYILTVGSLVDSSLRTFRNYAMMLIMIMMMHRPLSC